MTERRKAERREMEKMNDLFKLRLILVSALLIAFGMYCGVQMEKTNSEHLKQVRAGLK